MTTTATANIAIVSNCVVEPGGAVGDELRVVEDD